MTIWVSSRSCILYNTKSLLDFSGRPEIDLKVFEKHIFHNEICSGPTWKSMMPIWLSLRSCMFSNTKSLLDFSGRPEIDLKVSEKQICSGPTWNRLWRFERRHKTEGIIQSRFQIIQDDMKSPQNWMYNTKSLPDCSGRHEVRHCWGWQSSCDFKIGAPGLRVCFSVW